MTPQTPPIITPQQWDRCVAAIDEARVTELARWRSWLRATVYLLREQRAIGVYKDCWAFPNTDVDGDIRSIHFRVQPKAPNEKATWFHSPKNAKIHPLIYGDTLKADRIAIHESPWDAITQIDKLNIDPFATAGWSIVSTRGASNAKTLAEIDMGLGSDIYLFPQNPKSGSDGLRLF